MSDLPIVDWTGRPQVHIVGIGGMAMSGIAQIALDRGARVSGSDMVDSEYVARLRLQGARIQLGHAAGNLGAADLLVHSAAIGPENPEIAAAACRGIPVTDRASFIASLLSEKTTLAIAGTHGKTTTSAMASFALQKLGRKPAYLVGANIPQLGRNAAWGDGEIAVAEADEYARAFLAYRPHVAVIGHLEPDHLDYFGTQEALYEAFAQFARGVDPAGAVVARCEIPAVAHAAAAGTARIVSFGTDGDWRLIANRSSRGGQQIDVAGPDGLGLTTCLAVPGEHNALNALAAVAALAQLGIDPGESFAALAAFTGSDRRFVRSNPAPGIRLVDDYAHHPTEISAAIAAARGLEPEADRVWVVFQPHLRSRTALLFESFAEALAAADKVTVCHIYSPPGRDREYEVDAAALAAAVGDRADSCPDFAQACETVVGGAKPGDLILMLGAGDINLLSERVSARLGRR
ncbi:MAG: UDP-N-acetylmuramate--L-alanine ligase [Chloroflexota bacterium]|nr:UDP-N-acetylmuramate--L-alanine ligase [Chloroflexota bacterium]